MPVRFAFLTDTHHYPDAPHDYRAPKMLTRSQEVLDAIPSALNTQPGSPRRGVVYARPDAAYPASAAFQSRYGADDQAAG